MYLLVAQLPPTNKVPNIIDCAKPVSAPVRFIALETFEKHTPVRYTNAITNDVTTCTANWADSDPHMIARRKVAIAIEKPPSICLYAPSASMAGLLSNPL